MATHIHKVVSGTTYSKRINQTMWVFIGARDVDNDLRAFEPPRGEDGALACLITLETGSATASVWVWSDADTTADDDSTVIRPTSVAADAAGRWIRCLASGG